MNRLRLAQQGYDRLAAALAVSLDEETSDRAEAWLRDEVCPVVDELVGHGGFRRTVRWPLDRLAPGRDTPERRLVQAVDDALVRLAAELASLVRPAAQEAAAHPPGATVSGSEGQTIQLLASRPWFDLVCAEDFFHPWHDLHLRSPAPEHTRSFRSRYELRVPLGDYVTRNLWARIEYWKRILDRLGPDVLHRLEGPHPQVARERLFAAQLELDQAVERLAAACRGGPEARRRDACAALTQVYAAYAAAPRLEWLPLPADRARASQGLIRSCIRRHGESTLVQRDAQGLLRVVDRRAALLCDPDVLRSIAAALTEVAPYYELPEDADDLIDWARHRARLVLVDRSPREVYWEGQPVAAGAWDRSPPAWNLLWVLARSAGRPVDGLMLMNPQQHSIKSRRHRLSTILESAPALDGQIETVRGQGYRLQLAAEEIALLRDTGGDRLVFERAGQPAG